MASGSSSLPYSSFFLCLIGLGMLGLDAAVGAGRSERGRGGSGLQADVARVLPSCTPRAWLQCARADSRGVTSPAARMQQHHGPRCLLGAPKPFTVALLFAPQPTEAEFAFRCAGCRLAHTSQGCPTQSPFCSHPHSTDHSLCSSKHSPGSAIPQEINQHLINPPSTPPAPTCFNTDVWAPDFASRVLRGAEVVVVVDEAVEG